MKAARTRVAFAVRKADLVTGCLVSDTVIGENRDEEVRHCRPFNVD